MGMAASQARLLSITARLADNELRSQTINNAKMRLATQSSQASENYVSALNSANLMFSNYDSTGTAKLQVLDFNALTAYSSYNNQYGLVNTSGQLLVSESEAALFDKANGNLNAYLKAHGLEYTTTYFEQLGNIVNEAYPAPFDNISPDTMREMYEAYGSYENSIETDKFKEAYKAFVAVDNELKIASKEVLEDVILNGNNSPKILNPPEGMTIDIYSTSVSGYANKFKEAFNNPNNTYSINKLKQMGLTNIGAEIVSDMINSVGSEVVDGKEYGVIKKTEPYTVTEENGVRTHVLSHIDSTIIMVEKYNETTKAWELTEVKGGDTPLEKTDAEDPEDNYSYKYDENAKTAADVINSLNYTTSDGTIYFGQEKNANGELVVKSKERYDNATSFKDALDKHTEDILALIMSNDTIFDTGMLSMTVLEKEEKNDLGSIGVNTDKILKSGKKYGELLNEYKVARDNYLGFIEVDYDPSVLVDSKIESLLKDGTINSKDLLDTDKMLKILKEHNIKYTNSYQTVIKEFMVEEMVSEFGEPKYAWVDETDTSNKGNADAKAQWYTNLFNRMKQGYKILENGLASSSEWMEFALQSGIVTMEQVDKSFNWVSLDYKTCSNITEETENKELVAKAEAEYNRAMKDIDAKDNIYDMELKNIDTEHTALQTEYDSIKGVISKNIDRTFKFNQNG